MTVLLAVSGGTAEAQSVSFSTETATVKEGVAANADGAVRVKVTSTGNPGTVTLVANPPFNNASTGGVNNGIVAVTGAAINSAFPIATITLTRNQAELVITQPAESPTGQNWNSERTVLALRANAGTRIGPDLVLTTDDLEGQPEVEWAKTSIKLTEDSRSSGKIRALSTRPPGKELAIFTPFTDKTAANPRHRIRIKVEPANGIGTGVGASFKAGPITLQIGSSPTPLGTQDANIIAGMGGVFTLPASYKDANDAAGVDFTVMANKDSTGFKNPMIKLTLQDFELKTGSGAGVTNGTIKGGPPLMVEVISDEAIPTVSFSPTDISIPEGGRTTAALISEGKQGAEVNMVSLSVTGDAMVDLWAGTKKLAPVDGKVTVSLTGTNLARLTARSMSDRSLLDGQMKSKTWRITDADGANIDSDANSFTVTVEGSTAVPALPLVAQLLLALFLTAGGARLYRRRR